MTHDRRAMSIRWCLGMALAILTAANAHAATALQISASSTWEVRAGRPELKMRDASLRAGIVPEAHVAESRSVVSFDLNRLPSLDEVDAAALTLTVQKTRGLSRPLPLEVRALAETAQLSTGDWGWIDQRYEQAPVIGRAAVPSDVAAGVDFDIPLADEGLAALREAKEQGRRLTLVVATGDIPVNPHTAVMVWFNANRGDEAAKGPRLTVTAGGAAAGAEAGAGAETATASHLDGTTLLIRPADFQFYGGWRAENVRGGRPLSVRESRGEGVANAQTVINLPQAGTFHIWTRSIDYASDPGRRKYQLLINGEAVAKESGGHGFVGWKWEKVGTQTMAEGQHVLALHDSGRFYGRCDGIFLTQTDLDPNTVEMSALDIYRLEPAVIEPHAAATAAESTAIEVRATDQDREVASLTADATQIVFYESRDSEGQPVIRRATRVTVDGQVIELSNGTSGEAIRLLHAPEPNVNASNYYPTWDSAFNRVRFTVRGRAYEVAGEPGNPFLAGESELLAPRRVETATSDSVTLVYESASGTSALGRWELSADRRDAKLTVSLQAPGSGFYSLVFAPFEGRDRDAISAVQLPPVFQFQRVPESPLLVSSSLTPHPLAIVEAPAPRGAPFDSVSYAVTADPARLPFRWAENTNAPYGFSILNQDDAVQPVSFAPVLGFDDSHRDAGETIEASWRVLAIPGTWQDALAYASDQIMGVTDYRQPHRSSLTDAVHRMIDLMRDNPYAGWDSRLKGFYNIEAPGGVTQASPLMVLATARLTRDEAFYRQRALPTLEYLLSRDNFHFAVRAPHDGHTILTDRDITLHVPNQRYGTNLWQGADELLDGLNPWLRDFAFDQGQVRTMASVFPSFAQLMAGHRLAPDRFPVDRVIEAADGYVTRHVRGISKEPLGTYPHYNVATHPHWWDLVNLYDMTGERRFIEAAEEAGYHTIAGIWSHPAIPEGDVTIHPDGSFGAPPKLLIWHGWDEFSLGTPRQAGDTPTRDVPAWLVSPIGLGFEQPVTYFRPSGGMMLTQMVSWAGHLERLADRTGNELFRTYARNAIIGRWSNWPGYYLNGFTDLFHDPDYPREGPDITRLYYHHLPVHLAFTLDFLVAQMENRSGHRIVLPWVEQEGYAQFTNRIYGAQPGMFYGEEADLWLDPKLVALDTHDVDYLTARGDDRFWVVLMNQVDEPVDAQVTVNHDMAGTEAGASWLRYIADDQPQRIAAPLDEAAVRVPGKGLVAIALEASPQAAPDLPPVTDGHVIHALPDPWGELHAFRIRSPLGRDALYVVATGRPEPGARARIDIEGHAWRRREVDQFPYEATIYPWPIDQEMRFTFTGLNPDGSEASSGEVLLKGTQ